MGGGSFTPATYVGYIKCIGIKFSQKITILKLSELRSKAYNRLSELNPNFYDYKHSNGVPAFIHQLLMFIIVFPNT